MRLIVALVMVLSLFAAPVQGANDVPATNDAPPAGSVLVGQFTTGGCVHICETLGMCKDAYINEKNGDCWLVLNKTHADFINLIRACPQPDGRRFSAEMSAGNWRLTCAPTPADTDGKEKPRSRGKKATIPLGMQPARLEGVVGHIWDQSTTARICRKNGKCIPGAGSNIEIGDTIQAPSLVVLDIEDPGGYSRHGLTGKITDLQVVRLDDGKLALKVALSQGKMEGTIRKLTHVIRIGSVYCLAMDADYVAEATQTDGLFEIERGSGLCYEGTRKVRVDARNPRFEWEFLPASAVVDGDEKPDSRAIERLPDIEGLERLR